MLSDMSDAALSESDEQLRSVKEAIAYLSSVDLSRRDSETGSRVGHAVFNLVRDGYSRNRMLIAGEKTQICRGRVGASGRPFAKVSELWYPPAKSVRLNRANLPGECVFYSGTSRATAIAELKPKLGDLITLFEGRAAKETVRIKIVDYGDYFATAHLTERHRLFEQFTSKIFRKTITSQRHYMISAAIVSLLLRYDDALDGVMYSSVASDLVGANVVYRPSFADAFIKPFWFRAVRVDQYHHPFDLKVTCTHGASSSSADGAIEWNEITSCPGHPISADIYSKPSVRKKITFSSE